MRVSSSQPDVCRQNPISMTAGEFRRAHSPADGLASRDPGRRRGGQLVQCRLSRTEEEWKQRAMGGSGMTSLSSPPPSPSYRSSVHHQVPLRSSSCVVFWDKSLCISLADLEGRGARFPALCRSALSLRLGPSTPSDRKPAKTNRGYVRARAAALSARERERCSSGRLGGPRSMRRGHEIEQTESGGVNSKEDGFSTQSRGNALGLLSFRGPSTSDAALERRKENADEPFPVFDSAPSNFRRRQRAPDSGPAESGRRSKEAGNDKTEGRRSNGCSAKPPAVPSPDKTSHYQSPHKSDAVEGTVNSLSLKEALELFRPDFISRSQGRVRRLEQRARRRRALQSSNPDLVQGLRDDRGNPKRNCTTPDPLSDNLFKPRERSISGREMQQRSRRIYNKLPEVTKRKEEERKRAVSQSNRLRAEVYKKRILDQVLQR